MCPPRGGHGEPDLSRRLNRDVGDDSIAGQLTGQGDLDAYNQIGFATSLSQIAAWQNRDKRAPVYGVDQGDRPMGARSFAQTHGALPADMWMKGSIVKIDNDSTNSSLGLLHAGVDYAVSEDLVVGLMGQVDWADEEDDRENFSISGVGWMAGPYIVSNLDDSLILDARVAWGQSHNKVSPFNTYEDKWDSDRWLVSSKLTGGFNMDGLNIRPQLGLLYFEEEQKEYVDSNGLNISAQEISLGRLTFSPNLSWALSTSETSRLAANMTIKGIWDFDRADLVNLDTGEPAISNSDLRARTEGGLAWSWSNGMSVRANGFFDGIGVEQYQAYGGTVTISIPLE